MVILSACVLVCASSYLSADVARMPNMFEQAMQWTKQAFPVEHAYSSPMKLRRSPLSSPHRLRALMQVRTCRAL